MKGTYDYKNGPAVWYTAGPFFVWTSTKVSVLACAQELAEEIGLENILEVTKEFNQSQRKKEVEYRKRKDKELLEKGLITEEEYGDRDDDDVIYS